MKPKVFSGEFTITAHTGCEKTPDNTIEAVEMALKSGADIFEIDINFDKNGKPVLSHDKPVGGEPELGEVFTLMGKNKNILCNLDIKSTDNLKAVYDMAEEYKVCDRVFYTGINENFVESAKRDTPQMPYYLNLSVVRKKNQTDEYLLEIVNKVKDSGAIGINCNFRNVTPGLIETFRKNGLLVSVWTVNKKRKMLRMIKMKPDNITTRKPVLLKKLLMKKKALQREL